MIYVIQKSKRSTRRNEIKLTLNDAKEYLYKIDARSFRINEYMVYCGDSNEEVEELLNYFTEEYLIPTADDVVVVYKVNEAINKYSRLRNNGASVKAINNFRDKIQEEIIGSEVSILFNTEVFEILIENPIGIVKVICNYQLVIKKALALTRNGEFVDISINDTIVKVVNRIFRKQRYYYKQKNG